MLITDTTILTQYGTKNRIWQGIPGIECTRNGRLFATFYSGGIKEETGNYCLLVLSDDNGKTWSEPFAVTFYENHRCYDPCIWIDPQGRLWFFWSVMPDHAVYAAICENPDDTSDSFLWSEPRLVGHDVMLNKPIVLSTEEWLLPIAVWSEKMYHFMPSEQEQRLPFAYISADNGCTFKRLGGAEFDKRSFDEHMFVEREDGTLVMYIRTVLGVGKSFSYDGGLHWSKGNEASINGPDTRFNIRQLASGNWLLVYHDTGRRRSHLIAKISKDEGKSWEGGLMLDERMSVSYPDSAQSSDGSIYIIYDRERGDNMRTLSDAMKKAREILFARVTEEDILAGRLIDTKSCLRGVVSKLGIYDGLPANPYLECELFSLDEYVDYLIELGDGEKITQKIFTDYGYRCMSINRDQASLIDDSIHALINESIDDDLVYKVYLIKKAVTTLRSINGKSEVVDITGLLDNIFRYINENLARPTSLDEMATALNISKFYMCHLFRTHTNTSIVQYKNSRRVANSKLMLTRSDASVCEVAMNVGFDNPSYFSKWFRQSEGMTPSEFRNIHNRCAETIQIC